MHCTNKVVFFLVQCRNDEIWMLNHHMPLNTGRISHEYPTKLLKLPEEVTTNRKIEVKDTHNSHTSTGRFNSKLKVPPLYKNTNSWASISHGRVTNGCLCEQINLHHRHQWQSNHANAAKWYHFTLKPMAP